MSVRRRAMLAGAATVGFGGLVGLAGCLGGRVLPAVERDGDHESRTTRRSSGESLVASPTNELSADVDALRDVTDHFTRYSLQSATVQTYARLQRDTGFDGVRLWVVLSTYPGSGRAGRRLAVGRSDVLTDVTERDRRVSVPLDVEEVPAVPLFMQAYLVRADRDLETSGADGGEKLCETDPFVVAEGRLARHAHEHGHESTVQPGYRRTVGEGVYRLDFEGRTDRADWTVSFVAYKSAYVREKYARRKRRSQYVTDALADGTADGFGAILSAEAEANGFHTRRTKVEFLIDFVQNLPYVPDDVSTGYDDYTKHMVETLVEGGGDCEDTAVMLASVLQSASFQYDSVLLLLPGHMAVGVYGDDLPGTYYEYDARQYYYVETTGRGWDVGEVPDQYSSASASVYQV